MIRVGFLTDIERKQFRLLLRRQNETHGVARRANALLLLDEGMRFKDVCKVLFLDDETVRLWHKIYLAGGSEALFSHAYKGKQCRLSPEQENELSAYVEQNSALVTTDICAYILKNYGLDYTHSGCAKLLHRMEFAYKKPIALPKVPSVEVQEKFIADYEKLLNRLEPDETVYFADAVHPEYQVKPARGWFKAEKGVSVAIETTTSRKRLNIHGAINLENAHTPIVTAETINSQTSIQLLEKIEAENPDKSKIYVIWDGAAYHRSKEVKAWLSRENCRIHLIGLPPYCPHFNASERLWGVMHTEITHNLRYESFEKFKNAILGFFTEILPQKWHQFRDRITDNFSPINTLNFRVL